MVMMVLGGDVDSNEWAGRGGNIFEGGDGGEMFVGDLFTHTGPTESGVHGECCLDASERASKQACSTGAGGRARSCMPKQG